MHVTRLITTLACLSCLSACSVMKYVPDNKVLYTGYDIKLKPRERVTAKKRIKEIMDQSVSPKPNTSILGMRPGLWFYYKVPGEPKKGLKKFIKNKLGQVPVYMSDVDTEKTAKFVKGHLVNNGFFQAEVDYKVNIDGKKGSVTYTAHIDRPYRLRKIDYPKNDTLFANIDSIRESSYLKPDQRYNLERLQAEQERIEADLENYGYFFFDDKYLLFEADSTVGEKQIDLTLTLEKDIPKKATRIYRIGKVSVFPDYTLMDDSLIRAADTLVVDKYYYIDRQKNYKPHIITRVINLHEGQIYRRVDREFTVSHLMGLGSFKFVDVKFKEDRADSTVLNTSIYLTPYLRKSVRADFSATSRSNNFVGPGFNVKFTDRNIFKGSERFDLNLNTGYEVQVSRKVGQPLNAYELGAESSVSIPRFVSPFYIHYPSRKYLPTTDVKLGFRVQQRINYFRLNSFNFAYGYTWRENTLKTHELYPADVSYMKLGHTSPKFDTLIDQNRFLRQSLENQFIMGARYSYTLNTQVNEIRNQKFAERQYQRNNFYFNGKVESAGNLVQLIRGGPFVNAETNQPLNIFGSAYSQFVRLEADFRYYLQLNERNQIATRISGGSGYAFGNSFTMPYIKQFAVGGSNSVRAFPARSIGPGTYDVRTHSNDENNILFLDQRGDVKLETSAEYRADITKLFKAAVFVDAGNIWLWRLDTIRPGSQFDRSKFLGQLAVGTGAGIRLDFDFFVLRFDLAFPIRKPYLPEGKRWVWDQIAPGDKSWRRDNLILNIAIGYPF